MQNCASPIVNIVLHSRSALSFCTFFMSLCTTVYDNQNKELSQYKNNILLITLQRYQNLARYSQVVTFVGSNSYRKLLHKVAVFIGDEQVVPSGMSAAEF